MLQLVYISSAVQGASTAAILGASRRNNGKDGITGLLFANGVRFLQVLEGPKEAVDAAYARITKDPRHQALVVLSRRAIEEREFGPWEMAESRPDTNGDAFLRRVDRLLANATPSIRGTFEGLVKLRRAA